jgi:hypothetical protein
MPQFLKPLGTAIVLIAAVAMSSGCTPKAASTSPAPSPVATLPSAATPPGSLGGREAQPAAAQADFSLISTHDLAKEFAADGEAATKKYNQKTVLVEGTIAQTKKSEIGAINLVLEGLKDDMGALNVDCGIALGDAYSAARVKELKAGDKVKLVGEVYVLKSLKDRDNWMLINCKIVK